MGYCRAATTGPPNPQKNRGPQWTKPGGKARTDEGTPDESWIDESAVESLRRHVLVAKWLVRHGMRQAARPCHNGGERPTTAASSTANVMPRSALCRPCRSKRASSLVQDTAVSDQAGIAIGLADFVADGLIQCEFDSGDIERVLHVVGAQNLDVVRKPCPS